MREAAIFSQAVPGHQTAGPHTTERCNVEFVPVVNAEGKHNVVIEECRI